MSLNGGSNGGTMAKHKQNYSLPPDIPGWQWIQVLWLFVLPSNPKTSLSAEPQLAPGRRLSHFSLITPRISTAPTCTKSSNCPTQGQHHLRSASSYLVLSCTGHPSSLLFRLTMIRNWRLKDQKLWEKSNCTETAGNTALVSLDSAGCSHTLHKNHPKYLSLLPVQRIWAESNHRGIWPPTFSFI